MRTVFDRWKEAFTGHVISGGPVKPLTREQYTKELVGQLWIYARDMARIARADGIRWDDCDIWRSEAVHYPGTFLGSVGRFIEAEMCWAVVAGKIDSNLAAELYVSADVRRQCDAAIADSIYRLYNNPNEKFREVRVKLDFTASIEPRTTKG